MARSIILWSLIILCEFLFVIAFVQRSWVDEQIREEYAATAKWMGAEATAEIYNNAKKSFQTWVIDTGVYRGSYEAFVPEATPDPAKGLALDRAFNWFEERLNTFWAVIFRSFQRMAVFKEWFAFVALLFIPAMVDGWTQRAIKRETFGYASPVWYHTALYALVGLLVAPVVYLLLPIAVAPQMIPGWAVLSALTVVLLTANVQKYL